MMYKVHIMELCVINPYTCNMAMTKIILVLHDLFGKCYSTAVRQIRVLIIIINKTDFATNTVKMQDYCSNTTVIQGKSLDNRIIVLNSEFYR